MSYDLDVRSDARYSQALPIAELASVVASLPGVSRLERTSFVLDRLDAGIHVKLDLTHDSNEDDGPETEPEEVNSVGLTVAYPLLDESGPVALEMAFQIAERCGWSVYDPQGDCELTRETAGVGLKLQRSSGDTARSVLARAAAGEPSLGDLFAQGMWNHGLAGAAITFVAVAVAAIAIMFSLEWTMEDFEKYVPWAVAVGGVAGLWVKALVQAGLRLRRLRREAKP